jgi:hypothetical protein
VPLGAVGCGFVRSSNLNPRSVGGLERCRWRSWPHRLRVSLMLATSSPNGFKVLMLHCGLSQGIVIVIFEGLVSWAPCSRTRLRPVA